MSYPLAEKSLSEIKKELKKQFNYVPNLNNESQLNKLHDKIFWTCNLIHLLAKGDNDKMIFLTELHSDSLQLLITIPLGLTKASLLFLRSMIENTIKHIYYKDHPIELILLNKHHDSKLTTKYLFQYLLDHPEFDKGEDGKKVLGKLENEYHEFSKFLHSSSKKYFDSHRTLSDLLINRDNFSKYVTKTSKIVSLLLTLIVTFHKNSFDEIPFQERQKVLSCIDNSGKKIIHNL